MKLQKMFLVIQVFKANYTTTQHDVSALFVSGVKDNCLEWIKEQTMPAPTYAIVEIEVPGE